jgi:hypothetical protein
MLRLVLSMTIPALLGTSSALLAQSTLPLADGVAVEPLRQHCGRLLRALEGLKAPLPAETQRTLKALLQEPTNDPASLVQQIQELLDPHCLIGVAINPESRVKAARGRAPAELHLNRETIVLLKVHNEAGVTQALDVSGPQLRTPGATGAGRWLDAAVHTAPPLAKTLSGHRVEYVILRLTAHETGKREATLKFDVGQGTQDLGFRAEVPVLFTVRPAER